jgi:predicted peptidase
MVKILLGLSAIFLAAAVPDGSQTAIDGFIPRMYQDSRHQQMPYRLFIPKAISKNSKYPLIIWLHGAGGAGADNVAQVSGDQVNGTRIWTKPESQKKYPAFVLAPQSEGVWSEGSEDLSPRLALVLAILDSLKNEFSIDPKRIYLTGQSNGGVGVWEFICKKPDIFAAAIALCSAPPAIFNAEKLAGMPIWALNGADESTRILTRSREMIAAIRKAGGAPRYTEYKGVGHEVWEHTFKEPDLMDWLFAQHK